MWNPFSKKVEVEFIDMKTGGVFTRSSMPPESLPDTFGIDTTLHLPNGDWKVVNAVPVTKPEFSKSRCLRLWLEKVESVTIVDPKTLLFSLPTIGNELPRCDGDEVDGTELSLHEDDWRQVEWVNDVPAVEAELASVRAIYVQNQIGQGFNKLHVRKLLSEPLRGIRLTLPEVLAWTRRASGSVRGVHIGHEPRRVRNGFAIAIDGGWIYGLSSQGIGEEGLVTVLGFHTAKLDSTSATRIQPPNAALVFIDWCRATRTGPLTVAKEDSSI